MSLVFFGYAVASDFGSTGLIDTPTARMSCRWYFYHNDGYSISNKCLLLFLTRPRHGSRVLFAILALTNFFHYDRNYEAKVRLWKEQAYLPQVACWHTRFSWNCGLWGSEYLSSLQRGMELFDFTVGIGWGRLRGRGRFC